MSPLEPWKSARPFGVAHYIVDGRPLCGVHMAQQMETNGAHTCRRCEHTKARLEREAAGLPPAPGFRAPISTGEGRSALLMRLNREAIERGKLPPPNEFHARRIKSGIRCRCAQCVEVRRRVALALDGLGWSAQMITAALGYSDHTSVLSLLGRTKRTPKGESNAQAL
jgi:hypothetical protein